MNASAHPMVSVSVVLTITLRPVELPVPESVVRLRAHFALLTALLTYVSAERITTDGYLTVNAYQRTNATEILPTNLKVTINLFNYFFGNIFIFQNYPSSAPFPLSPVHVKLHFSVGRITRRRNVASNLHTAGAKETQTTSTLKVIANSAVQRVHQMSVQKAMQLN